MIAREALLPWLLLVNKIARTQRMIDLRGSRAKPRADRLLSCSCSINLTLCFCLPAAHDRSASPLSLTPPLRPSISLFLLSSLLWRRFLRFKKIHNYVFRYARLIRTSLSLSRCSLTHSALSLPPFPPSPRLVQRTGTRDRDWGSQIVWPSSC